MGGWVVYTWRAAVAGIEAVTALCAALNLAYFLHRVSSVDSPSRRAAAFVRALISLGSLAESVVVIGSLETNGFVPQETLDALLDELEFFDEHPHRIRRQRKRRRPHGQV